MSDLSILPVPSVDTPCGISASLLRMLSVEGLPREADRLAEQHLYETFITTYSDRYEFVASVFSRLFEALIQRRFNQRKWLENVPNDLKLGAFQCIRVLIRDTRHQERFLKFAGVETLAVLLPAFSKKFWARDSHPFVVELLVELVNIVKRISVVDGASESIIENGLHKTLIQLLETEDATLLLSVLGGLINLANRSARAVGEADCTETVLRILKDYDGQFKLLAAEFLHALSCEPSNRAEIKLFEGNSIMLSLLQTDDPRLLVSLLSTLANMALDGESAHETRVMGGIPLLLSIIAGLKWTPAQDAAVICGVCSFLTSLCLDDDNAQAVRQGNGVYLIGKILVDARWISFCSSLPDTKNHVQAEALRTLRFLFSMERNRKAFKRLFPPDVFSSFIDIGHYEFSLAKYYSLAKQISNVPEKDMEGIRAALDEINSAKGSDNRRVKDYVVVELLGRGAFGSVYSVKKERGETLYALKELDAQAVASSEAIVSEVEILKQLHHPNIVRYIESFVESNHVYIVMELVHGVSLLDHLTALAEKGSTMPESRIWKILIQLCLGLTHMHTEKHIVHRDLTPANILMDGTDRIKIADFGLARQRRGSDSLLQSVVGTMNYSCPEIVTHSPYTEKADIWSLGCILYQMVTLRPAFCGPNPLVVARKIVEGEYDSIPTGQCSQLLRDTVSKLLTSNPSQRPDIEQVCSIISPVLASELDRVSRSYWKLRDEIEYRRDARNNQVVESQKRAADAHSDLMAGTSKDVIHASPPPVRAPSGRPRTLRRVISPKVTINPSRLRAIADPASQILLQLHKIVYIGQLAPSLDRDPKRRIVQKYKRALFSTRANAVTLKAEILRLLSGSSDLVDCLQGSSSPSPNDGLNCILDRPLDRSTVSLYRVTYEELRQMIEECLTQSGYYNSDESLAGRFDSLRPLSDINSALRRNPNPL